MATSAAAVNGTKTKELSAGFNGARNPCACPFLRWGDRSPSGLSFPLVLGAAGLAVPSSRGVGHRVRLRSV